ncbi:uncharacterized protein MONOS_1957 [Monocercomonoides exilis]|uniref:uncharacterized protein n=1 Tax=Monocercomonoides exilis TaxID=2049356 RepID=UPI0035597AD4|nr:hypothetical protein MONOS_1957 [Monocercomonoides exilis]|eukprot:MONOS_1957.1-p1 / transcript=MONOS_1957.1 / gene=MONOS_1957 / organism=Monocercomonoides_exilis_PA203 / gene_product=unspecified product / transcript_product=unspecified product / location=Mono_scaffold00037:152466-152976(-) / protein_length=127 / sequence_SO=supercontig / SO=protein_coding / is_pseudo=false
MVKSNLYSEQLSDVELELQKQYQTQIHKLFDSAVTSINQPTNSESETSEDLSVTKNQQATVSSELSLPIISQKLTSSPVAQTEKSTEQTLSMRLAAVANSMRMQMKDELGDESEGEEEEETNEIGE